jgi:hypothetical protein
MPDMLVDLHVTDGIDFQYNLTYAMEVHGNMAPPVTAWERELADFCIAGMEALGDPIAPYTWPRERSDISKGIIDWASPPRLSTGYAAVRNRANMLVETHMMKPYKDRVLATYRMLELVLRHINTRPGTLRAAVRQAEADDLELFSREDTTAVPVEFRSNGSTRNFSFKGYASEMRQSPISGDEYVHWDHSRPIEVEIPFLDDVQPTTWVTSPRAYLVPQEWTAVLDVLRLHGIELQRLTRETELEVETTVFSNPKWRDRPYEGRFSMTADQQRRLDTMSFPAGTYVVNMTQPSARAALHLLEPKAPDSFVFWGFFTAIFEQKEYFEDYVMAEIALKMHEENPDLRQEFARKLASDSAFAASPRERLSFFYERSPYFDDHFNVYPVRRLLSATKLPAVREEEYR